MEAKHAASMKCDLETPIACATLEIGTRRPRMEAIRACNVRGAATAAAHGGPESRSCGRGGGRVGGNGRAAGGAREIGTLGDILASRLCPG